MNTNTMELNMNEMEQVSGGGIDDYLTLLKQGYDHLLCFDLDCHDYEWNGEWSEPFSLDDKWYRCKLSRCSRCGATQKSIGYFPLED